VIGMHNIISTPVVRENQIVIRPIMNISMTYDHRLLDGKEGAGFLKFISDLLNNPIRMLLI
jgi:2-oxoglutarate dehydrogenase E2 component (dihydrolipoamide succinyltransferase)